MYQFLIFLCGDDVVFTDDRLLDLLPTESHGTVFTMKLRGVAYWDRLDDVDLAYNDVRRVGVGSYPPYVQELQEHLRRKRYINDATEDVHAVLPCCRPPDLRCSSFIRSGELKSL